MAAQEDGGMGKMSERQWVTSGLFGLCAAMLIMAYFQPSLWEVKLFEVVLQAVVLTGLLNMVTAFHFAANQQSQQAGMNTGEAFKALRAQAEATKAVAPSTDAPTGNPGDPISVTEEKP